MKKELSNNIIKIIALIVLGAFITRSYYATIKYYEIRETEMRLKETPLEKRDRNYKYFLGIIVIGPIAILFGSSGAP